MVRWLGVLFCALALPAQDVRLQVLATADGHGHVLAQDSYTLQPANLGWARLATLARGLRAANPDTVLVDCGDETQGEPINYVWSQMQAPTPEPATAILNSLGCNAMVVGGQEFALGLARMRTLEDQAQFPWLAANVVFAADGRGAFTPYVKLDVHGVQVAVLGLSTAAAEGADGLTVQDPVATARTYVPLLRDKEKVDLVVVALHGGPAGGPCGPGAESQAACLAAQVPGIDLILTGNGRQQGATEVNGVPVLQPASGGQSLGAAEFVFSKGRHGVWELQSRRARLLQPGADTVADPAVLEVTAPLRAATETYLNTFATSLGVDLDGRWTRMEDTPLMHLLHTVARQASAAQITAMPTPGAHIFIPRGATSVRQFYALFPGADSIARIRVTGHQLRAYLEQTARFFTFSHQPDLFNRNMDPRDFDTLDGCSYTLDISRPPGQRVVELKVHEQPVKADQVFTLGLLSSRLAGSGGYLQAMGWTGQPEAISAAPFRNLLLEYVLSRPTLTVAAEGNWRTVPALDRERVLAQQP